MNTSLVKPLIKKSSSDCNILNKYRPISNLPFLSKLIERAVAIQVKKIYGIVTLMDYNSLHINVATALNPL